MPWGRFSVLGLLAAGLVWVPAPAAGGEREGMQQEKHFDKEITVRVKLDYLLFLPEGYDRGRKRWPLILFLHGAGERGEDDKIALDAASPIFVS